MHSNICRTLEHGVASPIAKSEPGKTLLIIYETGTRIRNAPATPCSITNLVISIPLKNPMKQNRKHVSRQSIDYALRYSAAAATTAVSLAKIPASILPLKNDISPIVNPKVHETISAYFNALTARSGLPAPLF